MRPRLMETLSNLILDMTIKSLHDKQTSDGYLDAYDTERISWYQAEQNKRRRNFIKQNMPPLPPTEGRGNVITNDHEPKHTPTNSKSGRKTNDPP